MTAAPSYDLFLGLEPLTDDDEDEEELEDVLRRDLEACSIANVDTLEQDEEGEPNAADSASIPAWQNGDVLPGSPMAVSNEKQEAEREGQGGSTSDDDGAFAAAWEAFLRSSSEANERFTAMQQSISDCTSLLLEARPTPAEERSSVSTVPPPPSAPPDTSEEGHQCSVNQDGDDNQAGGVSRSEWGGDCDKEEEEGEEEEEGAGVGDAVSVGREEGAGEGEQEEDKRKASEDLLLALEALGPSLQGVIIRAKALVLPDDDEGEAVSGAAPPIISPSSSHPESPVGRAATATGPNEIVSTVEGGLKPDAAPSEADDVQPSVAILGSTAEERAGEVEEEGSSLSSYYCVLALEARQHEEARAEEERRLEAEEQRAREEQKQAQDRAVEERREATELRRQRRQETMERLRWQDAVGAVARVWRQALERRRVRAAMKEQRRARELARRREQDGMQREEKRMRDFLDKEARNTKAERRRMNEEERYMRVWMRFMELERKRAAYEANAMHAEDQLARAARAAEVARAKEEATRRRGEREEEEREGMARQEVQSKQWQERWKAEEDDRRTAVEQRRLAMSLFAIWPVKEEEEWDRSSSLVPEAREELVAQWQVACADASCWDSTAAYVRRRWHEWQHALGPRAVETTLSNETRRRRRGPDRSHDTEERDGDDDHDDEHVRTRRRRRSGDSPAGGGGASATTAPPSRASSTMLTSEALQEVAGSTPLESLLKLELCVEGLTNVAALAACTNLQRLSLNVNRLSNLRSLSVVSSLVDVSLKDNSLTSLAGVEGLTSLQDIVLDINQLRSLDGLDLCRRLRAVSANTNFICTFPAFTSPSSTCTLQKLLLYHNQIEAVPPERLRPLNSLTNLDLGRNRLTWLSGEALSCCLSLTRLVISQNKLTAPPAPLHLPLLRELWLSGNRIANLQPWTEQPPHGMEKGTKDGSAPAPLRGMWLPSLRALFLQDNAIESKGFPHGALRGCPLLDVLELSFNRLSDLHKDVQAIATACPTISNIQLHDNDLASCPDYPTILLQTLPHLREFDGNEVVESRRWQARCQAMAGKAHIIMPFMKELSRRNRAPRQLPASHLEQWRLAPRTITCLSCGHGIVHQPSSTASLPSFGDSSGSGVIAVPCPQCSSAVQTIDFSNSNGHHHHDKLHPYPLDWQDVSFWHTYDVSKRRSPNVPSGTDTCASPPAAAVASAGEATSQQETVALHRLLTRMSLDTGDMCLQLAARHRRLLSGSSLPPTAERAEMGAAPTPFSSASTAVPVVAEEEKEVMVEAKARAMDETDDLVCSRLKALTNLAPGSRPRDDHSDGGGGAVRSYPSNYLWELQQTCAGAMRRKGGVVMVPTRPTGPNPGAAAASNATQVGVQGADQQQQQQRALHARRIQSLWRRFKARCSQDDQREGPFPPPPAGLDGPFPTGLPPSPCAPEPAAAAAAAVTKVQSAFRGFHVRRALHAALESARYVDRELDDLLQEPSDFDALIAPPPELDHDWEGLAADHQRRPPPPATTPTPGTTTITMGRREAAPRQSGLPACASPSSMGLLRRHSPSSSSLHGGLLPPAAAGRARDDNDAVASSSYGHLHTEPRPPSLLSMAASPTLTGDRRGAAAAAGYMHVDPFHSPKALSEPNDLKPPKHHHARGAVEQALLQEWGITDERLAQTLLHRRSKNRKLQGQQSRRENEKKSEYRYRKFVQQTNKTAAGMARRVANNQGEEAGSPEQQGPRTFVIGAGGSKRHHHPQAAGRPQRGGGGGGGRRGGDASSRRPAWASTPGEDSG